MRFKPFLVLCAWFLVTASHAFAANTYDSDGSRADVQAKITGASDGDTVTIPGTYGSPQSFTWTSPIAIEAGVHLRGGGAGRVIAYSRPGEASVSVGTGAKTFYITRDAVSQTAATITASQTLKIWRMGGEVVGGVPTGNVPWMRGTVTSYDSGTGALVMDITTSSSNFTGPHSAWIITTEAATTIVHAAAGNTLVYITEDASHSIELSGIRFQHDAATAAPLPFVDIFWTSGGEPVLLHDNYFEETKVGNCLAFASNRGVVWNTSFVGLPFATQGTGIRQYVSETRTDTRGWFGPSTMGMNDTTGVNNLYIESCDFHAWQNMADPAENAKIVIRRCLLNNATVGSHGSDSGPGGVMHTEVYDSEFVYHGWSDGQSLALGTYFRWRGGTGVITGSTFGTSTGSDYGGANAIEFGVWALCVQDGSWGAGKYTITSATQANPTIITTSASHTGQTGQIVYLTSTDSTPSLNGSHTMTRLSATTFSVPVNVTVAGTAGFANPANYPQNRQVGRGWITGTGLNGFGDDLDGRWPGQDDSTYVGDLEPVYSWGNTNQPGVYLVNGGVPQPTDPDLVADYIIAGRDYYIDGTEKTGWTRYTYPHPLRTDLGGSTATVSGTTTVSGTLTLP